METKKILWQNVRALMVHKYGDENLYRTMKDSKNTDYQISLGSLQRIKEGKTAIGLEVIDKIAHFFELHPWQLLIEGLDPTNPPVFLNSNQKEFFDRMKKSFKDLVEQ